MSGKVITFYSYKGGVGRSFALANVAALLARWHYRVLCIDWDIEAPGLDHYFDLSATDRPGLVDMLTHWNEAGGRLQWQHHVTAAKMPSDFDISVISAGIQDESYSLRAQRLDWDEMYERGLGETLEAMVTEMRERYDFILIDSRTGITDFGAIVTAQLPDILVFMFTANHQSLDGCVRVAKRARLARKSLPIDRGPLRLLPIVSRFEGRVEYAIAQEWRDRFYTELQDFYASWLVQAVDHRKIVDQTTIPHVPFWTFGEGLSVIQEAQGGFAPDSISYSIETIAALLAQDLAATEILAESRDLYVNTLQRREIRQRDGVENIYLSFSQSDAATARALIPELDRLGISCVSSDFVTRENDVSIGSLDLINRAQHMLVLVGREFGQWQSAEVRAFRTQSALDDRPRYLIPIMIEPGVSMPDTLLSYKSLLLDSGVEHLARSVIAITGGGPAAV